MSTLGQVSNGFSKLKQAAASLKARRTPAGKARKAAERGDTIFQFRAPTSDEGHGPELSAVEAEGWVLEETNFHTESSTETQSDGTERTEATNYAVYTFRRRDEIAPE